MSTLTEEEKRHIEERVKYENEVRARYAQSPASENTGNHGKKTYADQLSKTEIQNVIIPQFVKAEQITGHIESEADNIQSLFEENKIIEKEKHDFPHGWMLSVIFGLLLLFWCCHSYTVAPTVETYAKMTLLQKFACMPEYLFQIWGVYDKSDGFVLFVGFLAPFLLGFVLGYIVKIIYAVAIKGRKLSAKIKSNVKIASEKNAALIDYYNENIHELAFLPEKYQNHDAASHILELFQTCRVDSMKEAFNKYEEDLHNRHVEHGFETLNDTITATNSILLKLKSSIDDININTSRIK